MWIVQESVGTLYLSSPLWESRPLYHTRITKGIAKKNPQSYTSGPSHIPFNCHAPETTSTVILTMWGILLSSSVRQVQGYGSPLGPRQP